VGTDNEQIISDSEQEREYASLKQAELEEFQRGQEEIDRLEKLKNEEDINENRRSSLTPPKSWRESF